MFSDFAVVLAFVHLYVLFMVVPIFNTMMIMIAIMMRFVDIRKEL